jgi:hypothetical protein
MGEYHSVHSTVIIKAHCDMFNSLCAYEQGCSLYFVLSVGIFITHVDFIKFYFSQHNY